MLVQIAMDSRYHVSDAVLTNTIDRDDFIAVAELMISGETCAHFNIRHD